MSSKAHHAALQIQMEPTERWLVEKALTHPLL